MSTRRARATDRVVAILGWLLLMGTSAGAQPVCPVLALNGSTGYAVALDTVYPNSPELVSFTVEAWIYPAALPPEGSAATIASDDAYDLELVQAAGLPAIRYTVWSTEAIPNLSFLEYGYGGLSVGQWNHVALAFEAGSRQATLFINGTPGTARPLPLSDFGSFGNSFIVGAFPSASYFFNGYIAAVRVSNVARYTEGFTPVELTADLHTMALYRFGEPATATTFLDTSGRGQVLNADGGARTEAAAGCAPATLRVWTDDPIAARATIVKRVHVVELRDRIGALRAARGIEPFAWTGDLTAGERLRAVHVQELRTALREVYAAAGIGPPAFTDDPIQPGATIVRGAHLAELRDAVEALEQSG